MWPFGVSSISGVVHLTARHPKKATAFFTLFILTYYGALTHKTVVIRHAPGTTKTAFQTAEAEDIFKPIGSCKTHKCTLTAVKTAEREAKYHDFKK